jgi:HAD superfamily phosphoserine phosphatase-like hydrolase
MISVVLPALNEAETIASVVTFARRGPGVDEVIVIDDGSIDGTPDLARAAGATVVTSTLLGKGASLEDGVRAARNEVVLFLDSDLSSLHDDLIERMTRPVLTGTADFVKARFSRNAGRVTLLTARPLVRTFFPEVAHFEQPLGGILAARRSLLRQLQFENDYGVDIGLLIDAAAAGAVLAQVDIGHIEHDSQPLEALGDMAEQVVRTLLHRAACYGRLNTSHLCEVAEIDRRARTDLALVLRKVGATQRLALFDMDGTLLQGRYVVELAERSHKTRELARYLDCLHISPEERTRRIAKSLAGVPRAVFEETARNMRLTPGAVETIVGLRKLGYRVGIVTDSFCVAAEVIRRRVFADFSVAHVMQFHEGEATGDITLSPDMVHPRGCPRHSFCKVNVLHHLMKKMGLGTQQVLAVGDGENDICLLRSAGASFAYQPRTRAVRASARYLVHGPLTEILRILQRQDDSISA